LITVFNRKEVFVADTLEKFNEVRGRLSEKGIEYTYHVRSNGRCGDFGSGQARIAGISGSAGIDLKYANMYYLYVHKKDFELASAAIGGRV
jgi:hypothetical protein